MKIFESITVKGHFIKNRIVMPPMVCFGYTDDTGLVTDVTINHYEKRAMGGVGIVIVEATCIEKDGRLADTQLGIWSDDHITGLTRLAEAIKRHGALALIQIHHAGLKSPEAVTKMPIAPSADISDEKKSTAMSQNDIDTIKNAFVMAAERAQKAGFDGIELHGAHGYLISQFMSPITNKRQDSYGQNLEGRTRFAKEIIEDIRSIVKSNFIIGYRMGGNEPELEHGIEIAKHLENYGVDIIHVSAGISGSTHPEVPENYEYNWIVYLGTEIKKHIKVPVIAVNGIRTPEQAEKLAEKYNIDFVAVGKGLLADPYWVVNAYENSSIVNCRECKRCAFFFNGRQCPNNIMSQ